MELPATPRKKERIDYDGDHHQVFNHLGKEQVLVGVETWRARHLPGSSADPGGWAG